MDFFVTEAYRTREERDARWEQVMLLRPNVVRDTTSVVSEGSAVGHMEYRVMYPGLPIPRGVNQTAA